jgi:chemotaxis protein histidine kinase CheA
MSTATKVRVERKQAEAILGWCGWTTIQKWDDARVASKLKNVAANKPEDTPCPADLAGLLIDVEAAIEGGQEFEIYRDEQAGAGNNGNGGAAVGANEAASAEEPTASPSQTAEEKAAKEAAKAAKEAEKAAEKAAAKAAKEAEAAKVKADKEAAKAVKEAEKAKKAAEAEAEKAAKAAEKAAAKAAKEAERAAAKAEKATKTPKAPKSTIPGIRPVVGRPYCAGMVLKKHGLAVGITQAMIEEVDAMYGKPNQVHSRNRLADAWHVLNAYLGEYPVTKEETPAE